MFNSNFCFVLPDDFDDYEWEVKAKGCFSETRLIISGKNYRLNFYDPVRLGQEIVREIETGSVFFEPNVVVIKSVTRSDMQQAVETLLQSGQLTGLIPDSA